MGYSTDFKGVLAFKNEPTAKQLAFIKGMCGEDCREHPEWNAPDLYYIDLELAEDFSGIQWNGAEKTYDLDKLVNVVITQVRKEWPDFGLEGALQAQGEEVGDVWMLTIGEDGFAHKQEIVLAGQIVECPECEHKFRLASEQP
jgi:hypothetical protein